jgi:hypothetical protein
MTLRSRRGKQQAAPEPRAFEAAPAEQAQETQS